MNNYTFIQEGGMDGLHNKTKVPMEPEHFFDQQDVKNYLDTPEKKNQLLEQLTDTGKDPEDAFINIVDDYLEDHCPQLPKRSYIHQYGMDEKTEVDSGDRNVILNELRHEYMYNELLPYLEKTTKR